jgi:hypothetical protein
MKKILFLMVLLISIIGISNAQTTGATDLDQSLQLNGTLASEVTIATTTYSSILTLNSNDPANEKSFINFQTGAHILVLTHQTHDSVNALVYLQIGQNISAGTEGKDFGSVFIDTLQSANALRVSKVINIDLSPYLDYREVRVKVVAATGVAVGGMLPKWSAIIGAQGKLGKITDRFKAAKTIN